MNVHCFQHVPFEGLGYMEQWLSANNHRIGYTRFYEKGYTLPALEDVDALIVMGGPMNVYEEDVYPWLAGEKSFIRDAVKAGKKMLGVCLGAQLMAVCCGGAVHAAAHKEIGWFPVHSTHEAGAPSWLEALLAEKPVVLHWHGDQFDIPPGAVNLAFSAANANQAFILNNHILGLQFHLEITAEGLRELVTHCRHELQGGTYIQQEEILLSPHQPVKQANATMDSILRHFLSPTF